MNISTIFFWVVTPLSVETNVPEEHTVSIFRAEDGGRCSVSIYKSTRIPDDCHRLVLEDDDATHKSVFAEEM
jgi:hypothetical protein